MPISQNKLDDICWRTSEAETAKVLIDAANYFGELRRCLLTAEHSVLIVGWDVDGRTPLVGLDGEPDDDGPRGLKDFLVELATQRPNLNIHILLWDYSPIYALEREPLPTVNLKWATPQNINVVIDNSAPAEASHHQKIVVIDNHTAFCGGIDLTIRRWDTPEHAVDNDYRVDPSGSAYEPFHDVQMLVTGDVAADLGDLVRERWKVACGVTLEANALDRAPEISRDGADFENLTVGIARTMPSFGDRPGTVEVEKSYLGAIQNASRYVYIENQYLADQKIAEALAERLREAPDLELVIITPLTTDGLMENHVMGSARVEFLATLADHQIADRVLVVQPIVGNDENEKAVMVHAKLMIVDDLFLTVGSANLSNRSMGTDTECNLVIVAESETVEAQIKTIRNRLIAHFIGCSEQQYSEISGQENSLIAGIHNLNGGEHQLVPIDGEEDKPLVGAETLRSVGNPREPIRPIVEVDRETMSAASNGGWWSTGSAAMFGLMVFLTGVALAWRVTPLSTNVEIEVIESWLRSANEFPWIPVAVIATYIVLGLAIFPITVLILATAAIFGPWWGAAYALSGSLISAVVTYYLGRNIGTSDFERIEFKWLKRATVAFQNNGIKTVIALRVLPVAPFSVISYAAGASSVSGRDFVLGTVVGMAPSIAIMTALGAAVMNLFLVPDASSIAILSGVSVVAIAFSVFIHKVVIKRLPKRQAREGEE